MCRERYLVAGAPKSPIHRGRQGAEYVGAEKEGGSSHPGNSGQSVALRLRSAVVVEGSELHSGAPNLLEAP